MIGTRYHRPLLCGMLMCLVTFDRTLCRQKSHQLTGSCSVALAPRQDIIPSRRPIDLSTFLSVEGTVLSGAICATIPFILSLELRDRELTAGQRSGLGSCLTL
jgi:hypothetical protein